MRVIAGALLIGLLSVHAAPAGPGDQCAVAAHFVHADVGLANATAAMAKAKALKIVVVGTASSTLPGATGKSVAYPSKLEMVLQKKLPGIDIKVVTVTKARQTAQEMADGMLQILKEEQPALVIWQTGTVDAMRGVGAEAFQATLDATVERIQASGADVILMNMQYSPRTEAVIASSAYSESIRFVALQRSVNLFDRQAIMRHWNELGTFDFLTATKSLDTAAQVHSCIGSMLADLVFEAVTTGASEKKDLPKQ
jgi:hypothetical protein